MAANDLKTNIGKTGVCQFDLIRGPVTILDARKNFGRLDYLIQIVNGTGSQWVNSERVTVEGENRL